MLFNATGTAIVFCFLENFSECRSGCIFETSNNLRKTEENHLVFYNMAFPENNEKKKEWITVIGIVLFFTLLYALISLVNHYLFRTHAFDLGIKNHAIFDYAHFRFNETTIIQPSYKNYLANHFSLITIFVSPLYYLFHSYTLLIVQIASVVIGGLGVYKYFRTFYPDSSFPASAAMIHFFSLWGIYSALAFDYHENVVAAMILPWFFYFFRKEKWVPAFLVSLLIMTCKENMALWMGFVAGGLLLYHFKSPGKRWFSLGVTIFSFVYFVLVLKVLIPWLGSDGRDFIHFDYSYTLGDGFGEAFQTMLSEPFTMLKYHFVNHLENCTYDGIKAELHWMVLLGGGFAFLFKPHYLVMLIPVYAQKLLHDDPQKWGINFHYSIEFVPILTFALFETLVQIKNYAWKKWAMIAGVLLAFGSNIDKIDSRKSVWYKSEKHRFYSPAHYTTSANVSFIHKVIDKIPPDAAVSASETIVPHIAFRDRIYMFPFIKDADYVVLNTELSSFPLQEDLFQFCIEELKTDEEWELIIDEHDTYLFKR